MDPYYYFPYGFGLSDTFNILSLFKLMLVLEQQQQFMERNLRQEIQNIHLSRFVYGLIPG